MDDPIFDPWSSEPEPDDAESAAEAADDEPQDARTKGRWQSPGARTPLGRPPAIDRTSRPAEADGPGSPTAPQRSARSGGRELDTESAAPDALADEPAASTAPMPVATASGEAELPGPLRDRVFPRVEWLASRLRIAGHETVVDDRLGAVVPSLRLRLVPRRYPLVEDNDDASAVLEVTANERRAEVAVRLWLDPMATRPTEDVRIHAAQLTDAWIDRLLLEFVERTLEDT